MSQPQSTSTPPKRPSVNSPVPTVVPAKPQPQQPEPPQQQKGFFDYFFSCFAAFMLGLLAVVILTVLAGIVLEQLELRDDVFRAIEQKTNIKMPEHLKADPTEQQEPVTSDDEPNEVIPSKHKPINDEPSSEENPFIIE